MSGLVVDVGLDRLLLRAASALEEGLAQGIVALFDRGHAAGREQRSRETRPFRRITKECAARRDRLSPAEPHSVCRGDSAAWRRGAPFRPRCRGRTHSQSPEMSLYVVRVGNRPGGPKPPRGILLIRLMPVIPRHRHGPQGLPKIGGMPPPANLGPTMVSSTAIISASQPR